MNRVKIGAGIAVALLVALLAAWLWGSSGKGDLQRALDLAELRNDLLAARGALLSARVDLYIVSYSHGTILKVIGPPTAPPTPATLRIVR